ncbi:hypothetical protein OROGR_025178 [Orobanche gracilis]
MASSYLLLSSLSPATTMENRSLSCHSTGLAFIHNPAFLFAARPRKVAFRRCGFKSPFARKSLDHIPKQFRGENLKDGLMENYKNIHQHMSGLLPSEMDILFMKDDNPIRRQAENVTEIAPAVCELIVQQFLWLQYDDPTKPIIYTSTRPAFRTTRWRMLDMKLTHMQLPTLWLSEGNVCTLNAGMAYGQAGMLLSIGTKGHRMVWPTAVTGLYLPKIYNRSGTATDMWDEGNELDTSKDTYIKFLAKGIGKSKEEIEKEVQRQSFSEVRRLSTMALPTR